MEIKQRSTKQKKIDGTMTQSQPDIMAKLQRYFGADVEHMRQYETPMAAHRTVMRPDTKDQDVDWLSKQDPSKYRSGVGSLNYLVKHSRPDSEESSLC